MTTEHAEPPSATPLRPERSPATSIGAADTSRADVTCELGSDGVAMVTFDSRGASVNTLSTESMSAFESILDDLATREIKGLVIRSAKPGIFIAGADIKEIRSITSAADARAKASRGQAILNKLEDLPFVTVAAINGVCLGGGLELALACRHRIASESGKVRLGLPEVSLGIIPGFGGTYRLPRLLGLRRALDLILTGRPVDGRKALRSGLVTRLAPEHGLDYVAREIVLGRTPAGAPPRRKLMERLLNGPGRKLVISGARKMVLARTHGHYPAPIEALKVIEEGAGRARSEWLLREASGFAEMAVTDVSRSLVDLFFVSEKAKKRFDDPAPSDRGDEAREAGETPWVGVIGAGVMGAGIASVAARKGYFVRLRDISPMVVGQGVQRIVDDFARRVKRRSMTPREAVEARDRLLPTARLDGFARVPLVVEAAVEDLSLKRKILADLEAITSADTVFATNTSSLSVDAIAEGASRPGRVVGLHFFNPVEKMPLVEVVLGKRSDADAAALAARFARRIGKVPLKVKDSPGFLVNRCLMPYMGEALRLLGEGHTIEEIDRAAVDFGLPMGPIRLYDEVGLDVAHKVAGVLGAAFPESVGATDALADLVAAKRLGKKTGHGFYRHLTGRKTKSDDPVPDPESVAMLRLSADHPPGGAASDAREILDRLILLLVNEAVRCLDEGVVEEPWEVDLGAVFGMGFPPFRGGILREADRRGLAEVVSRLRELEAKHGARFAPARGLVERAESGRPFRTSLAPEPAAASS